MAKNKGKKPQNVSDTSGWTHEYVRRILRHDNLGQNFFTSVFGWTGEDFEAAVAEASSAMHKWKVKPRQIVRHPVSIGAKSTGKQDNSEAACKRLEKADRKSNGLEKLLTGHHSYFKLPHERKFEAPPEWFDPTMTLNGRVAGVQYDFPTIVQKFLPFAYEREKKRGNTEKNAASGHATAAGKASSSQQKPAVTPTLWDVAGQKRQLSVDNEAASADFDGDNAKRRRLRVDEDAVARVDLTSDNDCEPHLALNDNTATAPLDCPSNNLTHDNNNTDEEPTLYHFPPHQLTNVELHIGWLTAQEDGTLIVEKGFRSLNTWLESANPLRYNDDVIKESLRIGWDSGLQIFWFDDYNLEPWVAADVHALAGAIDRMSRKADEVCLFVARAAGVVGSLPIEQRKLQNQTEQNVVLMPVAAGSPGSATKLVRASGDSPDGPRTVRHGNKQYLIPGISVSLAKKLGEAVMKSRISYEYRDESGKNDSGQGGGEGGDVGKHGDDDGVNEGEEIVDEEDDYP